MTIVCGSKLIGFLVHQSDNVIDAHCGRLFAIRQEIGRHFTFSFDFDSSAALELVRLTFEHLIHFFRQLKAESNRNFVKISLKFDSNTFITCV